MEQLSKVIDDIKEWLVDYADVDVSNFEELIKKHLEDHEGKDNPTNRFQQMLDLMLKSRMQIEMQLQLNELVISHNQEQIGAIKQQFPNQILNQHKMKKNS